MQDASYNETQNATIVMEETKFEISTEGIYEE